MALKYETPGESFSLFLALALSLETAEFSENGTGPAEVDRTPTILAELAEFLAVRFRPGAERDTVLALAGDERSITGYRPSDISGPDFADYLAELATAFGSLRPLRNNSELS